MNLTLLYCMLIFILIGGIGMAIGGRNQPRTIQLQRWLKFGVYIGVMLVVLGSILYDLFRFVAPVIVLLTSIEFFKAFIPVQKTKRKVGIWGLLIYLLTAFLFLLFALKVPAQLQLFVYIGIVVFDAFSQVVGQIFGTNALMPSISPGKTREGLLGGVLFCIVASVGSVMVLKLPVVNGLIGGLITAATGFSGDILASVFKRKAGIKDYSNWLPGQGGFLDRFDSFIFAGAFYYLLNRLVLI